MRSKDQSLVVEILGTGRTILAPRNNLRIGDECWIGYDFTRDKVTFVKKKTDSADDGVVGLSEEQYTILFPVEEMEYEDRKCHPVVQDGFWVYFN